jgi:intracellular multiplication protein IcmD
MTQIVKRLSQVTTGLALTLLTTTAFADGDVVSLASQVTTQANAIATLLNVAAYVAGVGFALAGILQFKAHKENPQQVPLSKPIVMIVVAACLLFLPTIMNIAGQSLFGSSGQQASKYKGGT